ncbi:peptidase [Coccidioides immitis RMSCC 3703]|uniref:Peptide hydrolase n=1 Tax=Coccidioides immitis RMSCC 3703 TaxID=454286 RepID=A0A0J8QYV4_COCIT|nr:peptidase [Coccidioides immitis RMSCC 3703]
MKTTGYLALGAALVSSASAAGLEKPELGKRVPYIFKDLVSHDALLAKIKLKDLEEGIGKLQSFADANGKTRVFGEPGHKATVDYIYNELKKTGYYDVTKQEQQHLWTRSDQSLTIDGAEINSAAMTYSPSGKVEGELVLANNLGCAAEDYPEGTKGKIVVAERGDCSFADKNMMAHAAGASAAIIYNSVPGELRGTLGGVYDNTVPVVGISREDGLELVDKLKAGTVSADLFVESRRENRTTWNVLAQTKRGNAKNVIMLGAHSDSVDAGPGINDNGSGSIALLTIAKALTNFRVHKTSGGLFTGAEVVKTEEQAKLFGGEAGKSFDPNYHAAGDTVDNIHKGAFLLNTRGAAYAAAEYARSTKALPPKEAIPNAKRAETKLKGYGGDLLGMCEHKACNY